MINWQTIAFVRLFIPLAMGVIAQEVFIWSFDTSHAVTFILSFFVVVSILALFRNHYKYRWVYGIVVSGFLFCLGSVLCHTHKDAVAPRHFSKLPHDYLVGTIDDAPVVRKKVKCTVKVESCGSEADSLVPASGNILLYLDSIPEFISLKYGDKIVWQGAVIETTPMRNPNALDYKKYLHYQNIHYQGFVGEGDLMLVAHGQGNKVWSSAYDVRDYFLAVMQKYIPGERENGVANALLLGYKENLDEELEDAYMETGSIHILAVSGGHVGILFAGLMLIFGRVMIFKKWWRYVETLLILSIIWGFALITGFGASIARAALMFSLFLIGRAFHREQNSYNILAASAFFLVLYDPYMLFQVGFQLSYTAVLGMIVFLPYFKKLTLFLPDSMVPVADMIFLGVAAQLGTLPLALYYFHQFPMYFWLSGIVVVPMATVFMYVVLIIFVVHELGGELLAKLLGWLCEKMLWLANECILLIQQLPGSLIDGLWLNILDVGVLYLALGCLVYFFVERKGYYLKYCLVFLLLFGGHRAYTAYNTLGKKQMVLYYHTKGLILDVYEGFEGIRIVQQSRKRDVQFVASGNQVAHNVQDLDLFDLDTLHHHKIANSEVIAHPPYFSYSGKNFLVLDQDPGLIELDTIVPLDAVFITGNPKLALKECLKSFRPKVVVADATNSFWKKDVWWKICQELQIPFYDVKKQGAWISSI